MKKLNISRSSGSRLEISTFTAAVAGNPNAGKTTLFNALTGLSQGVGNYPGKTVAVKEGVCRRNGFGFGVVDLPGAYSLTAFSPDEMIAREFLMSGALDAVINVVDAGNLERNLYLTVQLLETGIPVVVALNMVDVARARNIDIDIPTLSRLLGNVPVIPTTASRGTGIDELVRSVVDPGSPPPSAETPNLRSNGSGVVPPVRVTGAHGNFQLVYASDIEEALAVIESAGRRVDFGTGNSRWMALQLLEREPDMVARVRSLPGGEALVTLAREQAARLEMFYGDDIDIITADQRYSFVNGIARQIVHQTAVPQRSATDIVDSIVTHRLLGLPIFLAVMYLLFMLVVDVSAPFLDWIDALINGPISGIASALLTAVNAPAWLVSLIVDGVIAGVGGVLVFVPGLLALFFFLAFLEDSGYLARAAFVMDRFMRVIGLHGKAVIPLLLGFGCAVPAVYATRTIPSRRDRLLTALLIPLMSCSARLPVYIVFGIAFFGRHAGQIIWSLYVLGVLVAILAGVVFTRTLLKKDIGTGFVLELPPYRTPTLKGLGVHMWENTSEFIRKAGTVIAAVSVVLWLLLNLPRPAGEPRYSYYGRVSEALAPVFAPLGFGSWETSGALVSGFVAKEVVVSSLSQIYGGDASPEDVSLHSEDLSGELIAIAVGFGEAALQAGTRLISLAPGIALESGDAEAEDTVLSAALRSRFTPLAAYSFLVFVLLYTPCIATIGAMKQEFGWPWAATAVGYQTGLAWLVAFVFYQGGQLLGFA